MRRLLAMAAISMCACAPGAQAIEPADSSVAKWLSLLREGTVDTAALLPTVRLFQSNGEAEGPEMVQAALKETHFESTALIDAHHCVGKMRTQSGGLFFVQSDCRGKIELALNFEGTNSSTSSDMLQAYQAAWNEHDPHPKLHVGFHLDGIYVDPTVDARGRMALAKAIEAFRRQFQGATLASASTVKRLGDRYFTFDWDIDMQGETLGGLDVGALAESGQVGFVAGFFSRP